MKNKSMDRTDFCTKIKEYQKQSYAVAYSILHNEADTEDAVCSAIQIAYEKQGQLQHESKFKAWFLTIVKNEALQIRRKRLELPGNERIESELKPVYDVYDELWDVLQKLPEEFRIVIVLYYYANLPVRQIAEMLEVPVGTVKSRLNRGKGQLKNMLEGNEGV